MKTGVRKMNKTELIDAVADRTGLSKKDVGETIDAMFNEISNVVAKGGEKVTIPGMVSFEQVARGPRKGFNPQTKQPIQIPASNAVKITAGANLKAYAKGTKTPPS